MGIDENVKPSKKKFLNIQTARYLYINSLVKAKQMPFGLDLIMLQVIY